MSNPLKNLDPNLLIALLIMAMDAGWKVISAKTKHMTPDELDAFITNKETSIAEIETDLEATYGP